MSNNEARVISAILKRRDLADVMNNSPANLFKSHKDIWNFLFGHYRKYREVPSLEAVQEQFSDFEYVDTQDATGHYIDLLRKDIKREELTKLVLGASKSLTDDGGDPEYLDKIAKHIEQRTLKIQQDAGDARAVDVRDIDSALEHMDKVRDYRALHDGAPGISTGFDEIDINYPTGFAAGHFIVILGYSGHMKSWMAIKLAINAWLKGNSVMYINLEMTPEELRDRILFLVSQYSMSDLVRAEIDPDDFKRWASDYMEGKAEFTLIGNEGFGAFTTTMVQSKIEQYKPSIVFADYLQLFSDSQMSGSEIERAKRTAREFKQLASVTNVPIVVITAVTGKDKKDRLNPPEIAQVAWSSEIEYAANLAFAVHTHRDDDGNALNTEIVCRKNRHGALFDFHVKMDLDNGVITEINPLDQLALIDEDDDLFTGDDED